MRRIERDFRERGDPRLVAGGGDVDAPYVSHVAVAAALRCARPALAYTPAPELVAEYAVWDPLSAANVGCLKASEALNFLSEEDPYELRDWRTTSAEPIEALAVVAREARERAQRHVKSERPTLGRSKFPNDRMFDAILLPSTSMFIPLPPRRSSGVDR